MIQMDANSRKLGKETRDMDSLHDNAALLYNASFLRGRFLLLFFCERLITLLFQHELYQKNVFLLRYVSEHNILTLNWNKTGCRNISLQI